MNTVDHVCVADHCIACCPNAQGYSQGYADAKSFYSMSNHLEHVERHAVLVAVILLVTLAVLWKVHKDHAND